MNTVQNRRVALLGPLPPLRGGIAQHTTALRKALERRTDLLTVAFRRTYPQWLYPGKGLHEPGKEDAMATTSARRINVDALAPWTWRSATRAMQEHGAERVVVPWWTAALAPSLWWIGRACNKRGIDVTFLCHNVVDHEAAGWKRGVTRLTLAHGDRFVVASADEAQRLTDLIPGTVPVVHPHPVYDPFPAPASPLPRRAHRELLFFGIIRPYKGLPILLEALSRIADEDWHLTIAGEAWQDVAPLKERVRAEGLDGRIDWIDRYVSAEEAGALFGRADAIVLPYTHVTGCGVLARALGSAKPVIASDLPGLREQVMAGATGWLVPPGDPAALAEALLRAGPEAARAMQEQVRAQASRWTWESLADTVVADG